MTDSPADDIRTRRIALVRHGQTDWNARNFFQGRVDRELDATGELQASAAARSLAGHAWTRVVTSPLTRARQTAHIIRGRLGLPEPALAAGLIEQSFGAAEGVDREVALARWPGSAFPGGESRAEVDERVADAWAELARADDDLVVVAHVVVIRSLAGLLTGRDPGHVANGSVTILERVGDVWSVAA